MIISTSTAIAYIQDFPLETFEHGYEIDTEHTEFHSYFCSNFFFPKTAIMLLRKSTSIECICKKIPPLEAAGSSRRSPLVYHISCPPAMSFFKVSCLFLVHLILLEDDPGTMLWKRPLMDSSILMPSVRPTFRLQFPSCLRVPQPNSKRGGND